MTWGQQNTEQEAHQQLSAAWDEFGLNFMDAAEICELGRLCVMCPHADMGAPRGPPTLSVPLAVGSPPAELMCRLRGWLQTRCRRLPRPRG